MLPWYQQSRVLRKLTISATGLTAFVCVLHADYGEPSGRCQETASGSGVFTREWSKATVQMDCNSWTPQTTWK